MCDRPSPSLLPIISAVVGVSSFVLGALLAALVFYLRKRRTPSLTSSFVQTRPNSMPPHKPSLTDEPYAIPIVSCPPSNPAIDSMSKSAGIETTGAKRLNTRASSFGFDRSFDCMKDIRHKTSEDSTVYGTFGSENIYDTPLRASLSPYSASTPREVFQRHNTARIFPGEQLTRIGSEPTMNLPINAAPRAHSGVDRRTYTVASKTAPFYQEGVYRTRSDSSMISYSAYNRPTFSATASDAPKTKAVSSPRHGTNASDCHTSPVEMPTPSTIRFVPVSPPNTPIEENDTELDSVVETPVDVEGGADLARQLSNSRAAFFYQAQAKRHLSLPFHGPRSSPSSVLPDSPTGAIGGADMRADFSFARGIAL